MLCRYMLFFLCFVLPMFPTLLWAAPKKTTTSKASWVRTFRFEMPRYLCHQESYFRKCYSLSKKDCFQSVDQVVGACLKRAKLPKVILYSAKDQRRAEWVGRCVGKRVEKAHAGAKKNTWDCRDRRKWF